MAKIRLTATVVVEVSNNPEAESDAQNHLRRVLERYGYQPTIVRCPDEEYDPATAYLIASAEV